MELEHARHTLLEARKARGRPLDVPLLGWLGERDVECCLIISWPYLVGGLEHEFYFPIDYMGIYGMSSLPLTNIFQRG